jgi:ethanolamine ammonia-lyase large subunit
MYGATLGNHRYNFSNLATLLAKVHLCAAAIFWQVLRHNLVKNGLLRNLRSQICHCALSWKTISFHTRSDEITRLIADMHNAKAFAAISHLTVGGFRDWLLSDDATQNVLGGVAPGVTPEMAAAVRLPCSRSSTDCG